MNVAEAGILLGVGIRTNSDSPVLKSQLDQQLP